MSLVDLPKTLRWEKTKPGWLPSAFTATRADDAAAHLVLIDQRKLPQVLDYMDCFTSEQVCDAISELAVRGAPALGVAGAYAVVLWAKNEWPLLWHNKSDVAKSHMTEERAFLADLRKRSAQIAETRPTAVNLSWGVHQILERAEEYVSGGMSIDEIVRRMEDAACEIERDDEARSLRIGKNGAKLLGELSRKLGRPLNVETHCNAGSLGTVRLGTATAVIYEAHAHGLIKNVWVDETRPVEQGARLTAWELGKAGVPYTLICDDMAGSLMKDGKVDAVIVGADRIALNGDVANKIGTYQLAVLSKFHDIPFYVAAPESTFDKALETGDEIEIEQRDPKEVRGVPHGEKWIAIAPQGCNVYNPAFDVTPSELITEIISD